MYHQTNHSIISIDAKKASGQNLLLTSTPKISQQTMNRKEVLQTDLGCPLKQSKNKANTILNDEKLYAFSSRSKTRLSDLTTSIQHYTLYSKCNKEKK